MLKLPLWLGLKKHYSMIIWLSNPLPVQKGVSMYQTNLLCFSGGTSPDTENDFLLAQMIQLEYDKEYDRSIDSMEKRYNGESKGRPSLYIKNGFALHHKPNFV